MTLVPFSSELLLARLQDLGRPKQFIFVASCALRLIPLYDAFARQTGGFNTQSLWAVEALLWDADRLDSFTEAEARRGLHASKPDPEGLYKSPFFPIASDVVQLLMDALDALAAAEGDEEDLALKVAIDASMTAQVAIDLYLGLATIPGYADLTLARLKAENSVDFTQTLMFQAELEKQELDLAMLEASEVIDTNLITKLKGTGFIGISPVERLSL